MIKVLDQKNARTGNPAPIFYAESEYSALNTYIKHLRPKLGNNID